MKSFVVACLTGFLTFAKAGDSKCRAIAFSSGDEDAAYQAGVLKGITNSTKLTDEDRSYDAVSGVSGGAVNAVLLAEFKKGQEA
jgi:predicted acylesterase/phospholipase RssA